jgi:hypothetical protein
MRYFVLFFLVFLFPSVSLAVCDLNISFSGNGGTVSLTIPDYDSRIVSGAVTGFDSNMNDAGTSAFIHQFTLAGSPTTFDTTAYEATTIWQSHGAGNYVPTAYWWIGANDSGLHVGNYDAGDDVSCLDPMDATSTQATTTDVLYGDWLLMNSWQLFLLSLIAFGFIFQLFKK